MVLWKRGINKIEAEAMKVITLERKFLESMKIEFSLYKINCVPIGS